MEEIKMLQDKVAMLELQLEESVKANADLLSENSSLKSQLETSKAEAQLNADLAKVVEEKRAELEAEVQRLQDKNSKYENPSFEHGGKTYEVIAKKANLPVHGMVTAADIVGSEELQAILVNKQSGIIREKV